MVVIPHESWNPSGRSREDRTIPTKQHAHSQKMKNEYFKKPRQILAIAKANPYLPHACGTFTGTLLVSPSSAPLEMLPSNKPRSSTHKDTVMGSKIHTGTGTTGTQRSSKNHNNNVHRGSAHQLYAPVSLFTLIDPTTWRRVWRNTGTVCRYKVILLLSCTNLLVFLL